MVMDLSFDMQNFSLDSMIVDKIFFGKGDKIIPEYYLHTWVYMPFLQMMSHRHLCCTAVSSSVYHASKN